ncbi:MAG: hypothetical protein L6V83_04275 [Christensenella sp.]|nr:MAG: hypothetical protein L6V83_04275 [Christensenella sp.]
MRQGLYPSVLSERTKSEFFTLNVFALTALAVEHQQSADIVRIMLAELPLVYAAITIAMGSMGISRKKLITPLTASPVTLPTYPAITPTITPITTHASALVTPTISVGLVATMSCDKMSYPRLFVPSKCSLVQGKNLSKLSVAAYGAIFSPKIANIAKTRNIAMPSAKTTVDSTLLVL